MRSHGSKSWHTAATVATGVASTVAVALAARQAALRLRRFSFQDKVVLVTGGERGLGLAIARELAHQGAHLILCGSDTEALELAYEELTAMGVYVLTLPCDVTDRAQIEASIHCGEQHFGRIDVLINNAGALPIESDGLMMLEDYEETMDANFWAPLYATLAVLPIMRRQGGGRIVNISSIGGSRGAAPLLNELPYSTGKYALAGLSAGLRAELDRENIVVTTVCPGLVRTLETPRTFGHHRHADEYRWLEVADSPPGSAFSAQRAARQILAACQRGDTELALSREARIMVRLHQLFPGLMADAMKRLHRSESDKIDDEELPAPSPYRRSARLATASPRHQGGLEDSRP